MTSNDVNETQMADILFTLNKTAKNLRDKQRGIVYKKNKKITKSNKGKINSQIENLKQQKFDCYEKKDLLLTTYFQPICIHKECIKNKTYEYISNMKGINLDKLMEKTFKKYFFRAFLDEKYQKKVKTININGRTYKTTCYCFNDIIVDKEIIDNICLDISYKLENILVKGNKIYIPYFTKEDVYRKLDFIFTKNLWNGKHIEKPMFFKTVLEFGNIKIARKVNIVDVEEKYYLYYKIDNHSFHKPIKEGELENYKNLEIKEVQLNTKGENVDNLVERDVIQEELNKLKR